MLEGQHFQNAYVTRSIDSALEKFRTRVGIEDARVFDATFDVGTPGGRAVISAKIALIWIDGLQYEIIEPVSGDDGIYRQALPAAEGLRFHHTCMRVDDWDVFREKVERNGYPIVQEGDRGTLKFLYLDARDFVGHYLEYCWMTPNHWRQMGGK
jgi:hypothetical protein